MTTDRELVIAIVGVHKQRLAKRAKAKKDVRSFLRWLGETPQETDETMAEFLTDDHEEVAG